MNIILETKFKKGIKSLDTLSVSLNVDQVADIVKTKGINAANKAIDTFISKYTSDLKKKLGELLNN